MATQIKLVNLATIKCTTPAAVVTIDGAVHEMVRVHPLVAAPAKNDAKSFAAAIDAYLQVVNAIQNGDKVDILDDDGNVAGTVAPTDDIPSLSERTELKEDAKNPDKVTSVTINHGQNMPLSLPGQATTDVEGRATGYAGLIAQLNEGIRKMVGDDGRNAIVQEFRVGGGKRGRKAAGVDLKKFA